MINKIFLNGVEYGGDELVDCKVVAVMTGLSRRTIEDMTSRREIPMYKLSRRANRYRVREILDWIEARRVDGGAA